MPDSPCNLSGWVRWGWKPACTLSGGCIGQNSSGEEVGLKPGCTDGEDKSRTCTPERECGPSLSKSFLQVIGPYCHAVELPPCSQKDNLFFLSLFKTKDFTLYIICVCLYMQVFVHVCACISYSTCVEVRGQLSEISVILPQCAGLVQQVLFPMSHHAGPFF